MITLHAQAEPKPAADRPGVSGGPYWEILVIAAVAVAVRVIHLDAFHDPDDYYMLLAAQSWLREGTLSIAGGTPYERASLYTYIVAGFMYVFGETSHVARIPAALAGAGGVTLLFVWLRTHVARSAAWAGAFLLCVDPGAILLSRLVRFYTLHTLVFLAFALGVYHLATRPRLRFRSVFVALGVLLGFAVAYRLQLTTVIGTLAVGVWLLVDLTPRVVRWTAEKPTRRVAWLVGVGVAVTLLSSMILVHAGLAARFLESFRSVPLWAAERQDQLGFYFRGLRRAYPMLWALFPVAAVVAIARFGRAAVFTVVLFSVPFVLHSLAAFKAERYLSYAMPFFFATWGIAFAAVLPGLLKSCEEAWSRVLTVHTPSPWSRIGTAILLAVIFGGVAYTTPAFHNSYRIVQPDPPPPVSSSRPDWGHAGPLLAAVADSADVVVGSFGPSILYHLGRVDVVVAANHMPRQNAGEFAEARQMGRPVISEPGSMESLIRCYRSGLVVVDWGFWKWDAGVTEELASVIMARTVPVPLPSEWNIHAYRWDRDGAVDPSGDCPDLGSVTSRRQGP